MQYIITLSTTPQYEETINERLEADVDKAFLILDCRFQMKRSAALTNVLMTRM